MNETGKSSGAPRASAHADSGQSIEAARHLLGDRYEILGLIGAGGMGSVYRAWDRQLEEVVALKMLRRELANSPTMLERFRREVKLARRVTHKNVARVFDISEHGDDKFLTMEFVDGESLAAALAREGALDLGRAVEIASAICAGLASAHAAGVIHRDLKPDNVLLAADGRVVVTDFGIARALVDASVAQTMGGLVGTPAYMAPEQVERRQDLDARADIYALGELLYEMLTGQRAWPGSGTYEVTMMRLFTPPPDPRHHCPTLPRACAEVVMRCMARRPEDRFATVEEVASELSVLTLPLHPAAHGVATIPPVVTVRAARLPESSPPIPAAPKVPPGDKTVAVLPFRNAGPKDDEYLAEELTDDLIDNLSMTRGLKIRSRGAVMRFKGVDRDGCEVGRELGVQVVVEGSVRRSQGKVRITARLTSVEDGFQLWAKRFDRPEGDVLSINDEAASAIAEALTVDHDGRVREAPSNPAAVDIYMRARHEFRKFWTDNPRRALELFEQAEALAPGDPLILSGKAMALSRCAFFAGQGAAEAVAIARRAVAIAPTLAEARLSLGAALVQTGDWAEGARELRVAVTQGPGLSEAHGALGRLLVEADALREGMRLLEIALAIDAQQPINVMSLARSNALLGRWEQTDAIFKATDPSILHPVQRMRFLTWRRDLAGMKALLEQIEAQGEPTAAMVSMTRLRHLVRGEIRDRNMIVARGAVDYDPRRRAFMLQLDAESAAFVGDNERVLLGLEESAAEGLFDLAWLDRCPLLDGVRADPRFAKVRALVAPRAERIVEAYRSP